jgi:seryl-tRNA synthetase
MWTSNDVLDTLRKVGELWEPRPGLVSLRGDALELLHAIEGLLAALARSEGFPEWRLAPGLDLETLARARYFESFPQWLTAAGHLSGDTETLEAVARADDPAGAATRALEPAECALSPALCYHVYARLAGATVQHTRMTALGTCWRHEGERLRALERGWAFTMRELVVLGTPDEVDAFRRHGMGLGTALAVALGLDGELVVASDPFFAPTARGRKLLQKVKSLKHELMLPLGDGRRIAAASFNDHERFFGEAFDIRLTDGASAASGCVAFGVERLLLAFLVAHGPHAAGWPAVESELSAPTRSAS